MNYFDHLKSEDIEYIDIDISIYSKNCVLKTCYKFTDRAYIFIQKINNEYFRVYFENKNNEISLLGSFMNELLDQELREIVNFETKKIRETIVTKALLGTSE